MAKISPSPNEEMHLSANVAADKSSINLNAILWQGKMLKKSRIKSLSLIESMPLYWKGKMNGKKDLPGENSSGEWVSPFLMKEKDAYSQYVAYIWAKTQELNREDFRVLEALVQEVLHLETKLSKSLDARPTDATQEDLTMRKSGEEALPQNIVTARRKLEFDKKNAPYYRQLSATKRALEEAYYTLYQKKASIKSIEDVSRLICEKAYHHTALRMDQYINGAMHTHPQPKTLKDIKLLPYSDPEATYLSQTKDREVDILAMIERKKIYAMERKNNEHF